MLNPTLKSNSLQARPRRQAISRIHTLPKSSFRTEAWHSSRPQPVFKSGTGAGGDGGLEGKAEEVFVFFGVVPEGEEVVDGG